MRLGSIRAGSHPTVASACRTSSWRLGRPRFRRGASRFKAGFSAIRVRSSYHCNVDAWRILPHAKSRVPEFSPARAQNLRMPANALTARANAWYNNSPAPTFTGDAGDTSRFRLYPVTRSHLSLCYRCYLLYVLVLPASSSSRKNKPFQSRLPRKPVVTGGLLPVHR